MNIRNLNDNNEKHFKVVVKCDIKAARLYCKENNLKYRILTEKLCNENSLNILLI